MVSGCPLFRGSFALKSHVGSLDLVRCPESRSVRFSEVANILYITMLNSIGNTALVRCREVVRFSEGPGPRSGQPLYSGQVPCRASDNGYQRLDCTSKIRTHGMVLFVDF